MNLLWIVKHSSMWFVGIRAYYKGVTECWNLNPYLSRGWGQWQAGWHWGREVGGLGRK